MNMIRYIAYAELGEFYTLQEVCHMLEMSKDELRKNCEKYNVRPSQNEIGDWGLNWCSWQIQQSP